MAYRCENISFTFFRHEFSEMNNISDQDLVMEWVKYFIPGIETYIYRIPRLPHNCI